MLMIFVGILATGITSGPILDPCHGRKGEPSSQKAWQRRDSEMLGGGLHVRLEKKARRQAGLVREYMT